MEKEKIQFNKKDWRVEPIPSEQTHDWLLNKHYAKRIPPISYAFGLYKNKQLLGVCTLATPPIQMNDGWCLFNNGDIRNKGSIEHYSVRTMELNRLVVSENLGKNVLSFFVSKVFLFLPKPMVLVSFADPTNGHNGYIYQATNWVYTGKGELGGKSVSFLLNGRDIHGRGVTEEGMKAMGMKYDLTKSLHDNWKMNGGEILEQERKHRYLYFLGNEKEITEMKRRLKYPILPYPKGENKRYDASYEPTTMTSLF